MRRSARTGSKSLLGKGGMGEVYRAHDTGRDRTVALKLLPPHLAEDPTFQERFRRECRTLARLDEPHVIPIHDFGEIDGQLYLDMRLVKGGDLRGVMRDRGALEPAEAVALIEQMAAALDAAHQAGLVHRDVKPENVLITGADFAYLVDFGVAHADTDTHLTRTGTAVGSVAYMAPEQFEDGSVTAAADVYALAAVLFELLTARKPYPGESISTITKGLLFDPIPVASRINPAITPAMDAVLAWGLDKDPARRCPSALGLAEAARAALSGERPPTVGESETGLIGGADSGATAMVGNSGLTAAAPQTPAADRSYSGPTVAGPGAIDLSKSNPANPVVSEHSNPAVAVHPSSPSNPAYQPTTAAHLPPTAPPTGPMMGQPGPMGQPYGYYAPPPPPPQRTSTTNILLIAVIVLILGALIGIGAWVIADKSGSNDDAVAATAPGDATTTVTTVDGTTTTYTTTQTPTQTWTPSSPPSDNQPCSGYTGVGTGYPQWTGCEFAANVRDAYVRSGEMGGSRTVNGWAPQQQRNYVMTCGPYQGVIACRGGNQAVVYIY
ncbi:MAG: serine/threonine-protein kinase [Gordonia sp. (in: high G+C Gram-positive bacteria)]|uniref:serine/threonine-protein kinase n=1 Tax=Gordonia sp. (in: high G+C Gram-positive bacteria) TaxID=84139 RepID=UPI0039E4617A